MNILEKNRVRMSSHHNNTIKIPKSYILNKHTNLLASNKIKSPINNKTYINIDIKTTPISLMNEHQDYILTFENLEYLHLLKKSMQHPYVITTNKISDITYYLERMNSDLLIISDVNCDHLTKKTKYTAYNINIDKLLYSKGSNLDVEIHKFIFDNSI